MSHTGIREELHRYIKATLSALVGRHDPIHHHSVYHGALSAVTDISDIIWMETDEALIWARLKRHHDELVALLATPEQQLTVEDVTGPSAKGVSVAYADALARDLGKIIQRFS